MALLSFPLTPVCDGEIQHESTPTVEIIRYGEGYTGRWVNGINAVVNRWTLRWTNLYSSERAIVYNFVVARKGAEAFWYKFVNEELPRMVIAPEGIRETRKNGEFFDMEVVIEEVFDLGHNDAELSDIEDWIVKEYGDEFDHNITYVGPETIEDWTIEVFEASHPIFFEAIITITDAEECIALMHMEDYQLSQLSEGKTNWFRIKTTYGDGVTFSVSEKIGVEMQ